MSEIIHNLQNGNQIKIIYNDKTTECLYLSDDKEILLIYIDNHSQIAKMFPLNTRLDTGYYLTPKYNFYFLLEGYDLNIEERENDEYVISELPEIFIKTIQYGLGLKKEYRFIAELANNIHDCKTITISNTKETKIDEKNITINDSDLDKIRRGLDRITDLHNREARNSKQLFVYNEILHNNNSELYPMKKIIGQKDILYKIIKDRDFSKISKNDKKGLLNIKDDIDFSYISALKNEFDEIIKKNYEEKIYQKFFEENPVLLTLFIGSPYVQFKNQAYVGGKSFDNSNGQFPDFLFKHKLTNNSCIIELKCPKTSLLEIKPYRETGVYSPSKDLAGSVSQVLLQKYQLETNIATLKHNSEDKDVEAYNVQGVLIIGLLSNLEGEQKNMKKRSFELFRNNQSNLRIITYDECQEQLNYFLQRIEGDRNAQKSINPTLKNHSLHQSQR